MDCTAGGSKSLEISTPIYELPYKTEILFGGASNVE